MEDPSDFTQFGGIVNELESLLGVSFGTTTVADVRGIPFVTEKPPVSEWIRDVLHDELRGDVRARTYGMCRIIMLVRDLRIIASYDQEFLSKVQMSYRQTTDNEFWGLRFEVDIMSTLIEKQLPFERGASLPGGDAVHGDFVFGGLAIECTSSHVVKERPLNSYLHKLGSAIRDKARKPYAKSRVALFIDITNLLFHRTWSGVLLENSELRGYARRVLSRTVFGAVVFSLWFVDEVTGRYQNLFVREDHEHISPDLAQFLDDGLGLDKSLPPLTRITAFRGY